MLKGAPSGGEEEEEKSVLILREEEEALAAEGDDLTPGKLVMRVSSASSSWRRDSRPNSSSTLERGEKSGEREKLRERRDSRPNSSSTLERGEKSGERDKLRLKIE